MMKTVWKNFRFLRFFTAFTAGNLGDWFDIFALQLIFVHEFHAGPIVMGFLGLIYFIPGIVLGPLTGVCADRFSKRDLMIISDIISGILTIGLFFSNSILVACLLVFMRSGLFSLNSTTQQGYMKQVVSEDFLLQASSYMTMVFQLCKMLGPLLGAVLLIYFPARSCIAINAVSFIISATILLTLPRDTEFEPSAVHQNLKIKSWAYDLKQGVQFVWFHRLIKHAMWICAVWFFCGMVRNSQLVIFLKHILPQQPNALGFLLGLDALGAFVSGGLISRIQIRNYGKFFGLGFLLMGLGMLGIALYHASWPRWLLYLSPFILGLGSGMSAIIYGYLLKKETAAHQIGCVYGIKTTLQNTGSALGTALSGFIVLMFGIREVFLGISIVMFLLMISSLILVKSSRI